MYLLAVIKFPKWALKIINFQMAHFLWSDEDGNKKWDVVGVGRLIWSENRSH
jgi:hypothetical protein